MSVQATIETPAISRSESKARRPKRRNRPSAHAQHSLALIRVLRLYFRSNTELAGALGWSRTTVSLWLDGPLELVEKAKYAQVRLLLDLCEETEPFVRKRSDVGSFVLAPMPTLNGDSAASFVLAGGHDALVHVRSTLIDANTRVPFKRVEHSAVDAVDAALAKNAESDPAAAEMARALAELES